MCSCEILKSSFACLRMSKRSSDGDVLVALPRPVASTEDNDSKERSARRKIGQVGNHVANIIRIGWEKNLLPKCPLATDKIALLFFSQALLTQGWTLPALSVCFILCHSLRSSKVLAWIVNHAPTCTHMSEVTVWMRKQADNKNLVPPFGYWLGNASFHHGKKRCKNGCRLNMKVPCSLLQMLLCR